MLAEPVGLLEAPGVVAPQHVAERLAGVHGAGVDAGDRLLAREATLARAEPEFVAQQVHHVGGVGLVEHGERGVEPQRASVQPQQAVADRMERAAPDARRVDARTGIGRHALGARGHLARRTPAEREQQHTLGPHAVGEQAADPGGEGGRLAGARAGDDQQRPLPVRDGLALGVVQLPRTCVRGCYTRTAAPRLRSAGRTGRTSCRSSRFR